MTLLYEWAVARVIEGQSHVSPVGVTDNEYRARRHLLEAFASVPHGLVVQGSVTAVMLARHEYESRYERLETCITAIRDVQGVVHFVVEGAHRPRMLPMDRSWSWS
jgi:hypothetical protein